MASHDDDYELFEYRRVSIGRAPMISLQKRGTFSLNRIAVEALGSPGHVQLFYSRKKRRVGFRAAEADAPHTYSLSPQTSNSNYQIGAKSFCLYYNIPFGEGSRRFTTQMDGDMLSIDLDEQNQTIPSPRRRNTRGTEKSAVQETSVEQHAVAAGH